MINLMASRIARLLLGAVLLFLASATLSAEEVQPEPRPTPAPVVEAWAMLFQMMDRLHSATEQREFSLVHNEDPLASAAVSTLIAEVNKSWAPSSGAMKVNWIAFVRTISALHTAADAGQGEACRELVKKADDELQELEKKSDPAVLKAAHQYAERYTCPMHPDVIGAKGDTCGKCGMPLDQPVVLLAALLAGNLAAQSSIHATITTDVPLAAGKPAQAVLHLRRDKGEPVTLSELIETHTRKIHLLIVDQSLTDYHHEHPQPTDTPGDYAFEFTPGKPGSYFAWADVRPLPLGLEEYEKAVIAGSGTPEPIADKATRLEADSEGFHFALSIEQGEVRVGQVATAKLRVTRDGKGFTELEPVMAAFAHLVGFNEDGETVLHMHPIGASMSALRAAILHENDRGGPELEFKIYATKPGFMRLFAQVQINGRQVFAPFGFQVAPL
jgi:hypothetical protein